MANGLKKGNTKHKTETGKCCSKRKDTKGSRQESSWCRMSCGGCHRRALLLCAEASLGTEAE